MKKIIMFLLITIGVANASIAYGQMRTYTQPDGTTFQGKGQGLSRVHWIETVNGDIVKYNFEKKAYYEINFDNNGDIVYTKEYLKNGLKKTSLDIQSSEANKLTSKEKKEKLLQLIKRKKNI